MADTLGVQDLLPQLVGETVFSVKFVKRGTNEIREMLCRFGVTKHLRGGDRAYEPKDKDLIFVFDMGKKGYRSIPIEGIIRVVGQGRTIFENSTLVKKYEKKARSKRA